MALDKNGKPTHVAKLALKTDEDRTKFDEGKIRMEKRIKKSSKIVFQIDRDHFKNNDNYL